MKNLFYLAFIIILMELIMMLMLNFISKKTYLDSEKTSPFECGFNPKMSARFSFSLHFFLISIIFLIFDVEIVLLLPMILTMKMINMINYLKMFIFFISILLIGIYYEWYQGALTWKL